MELTGNILTDDGFRWGTVRFGRRIVAVEPGAGGRGPVIVPGFVDLHVHGGDGGDVMDGEEGLRTTCRFHASRGTTALAATTVTAPLEGLERAPEIWELERLLELAPVLIVTLAPEIAGCQELVDRLVQAGVRVQIGHSGASAEVTRAALTRGVQGFTHLFNAMSGFHHRDPGVVGAALAYGEEAELILDGRHVAEAAVRAAWRALPRWYAVSDAVAAAGGEPGEYRLGTRTVRHDGHACRLADGTLAGSVTTLDGALRSMRAMGLELQEAARRVSTIPASVAGLEDRGRIAPGCVADMVELDEELAVRRVWIGGRERTALR